MSHGPSTQTGAKAFDIDGYRRRQHDRAAIHLPRVRPQFHTGSSTRCPPPTCARRCRRDQHRRAQQHSPARSRPPAHDSIRPAQRGCGSRSRCAARNDLPQGDPPTRTGDPRRQRLARPGRTTRPHALVPKDSSQGAPKHALKGWSSFEGALTERRHDLRLTRHASDRRTNARIGMTPIATGRSGFASVTRHVKLGRAR
jgi:hypothetical protein